MKQTVNLYYFREAFNRMDRGSQFSYEALEVLFNGLEEFEDDTGEETELDVISLCCDFSEMTLNEIIESYSYMMDEARLTDDDAYTYVMDWLHNQTWVLGDTPQNTFVFRQF